MKPILTTHFKERFIERSTKRYEHLRWCEETNCEMCQSLQAEIKQKIKDDSLEQQILQRIDDAEENRSYLNNSSFMERYYEKYGYDKRFSFLVHKDLLFIAVYERGRQVFVTCVWSKTHLAGRAERKPRYNRLKQPSSNYCIDA